MNIEWQQEGIRFPSPLQPRYFIRVEGTTYAVKLQSQIEAISFPSWPHKA